MMRPACRPEAGRAPSWAVSLTAALVLSGFLACRLGAQAVIADSFDDWSTAGTQGEKNWYNGYYNQTEDATIGDGVYQTDDFLEFVNDGSNICEFIPDFIGANHWTGTQWDLNCSAQPWTEIGRENTHPNGINFTNEHWTIRRWVSDRTKAGAAIRWQMRKGNPAGSGVTGILLVNGVEKDSVAIGGTDSVGVNRLVDIDLTAGDLVELALTPVGLNDDPTDGADGSFNRLTIYDGQPDLDGDGDPDTLDNCPTVANSDQADGDSDGVGNVCDNCPLIANADQSNSDGDLKGDVCDDEVADSVRDWSTTGTQGENDWYNGYYNQTEDAALGDGVYQTDDFIEFVNDGSNICETVVGVTGANHWAGTLWELNCTGAPWTELGRDNTHPNGTNNVEVHWTIRRYIYPGPARQLVLRWHMRKTNPGCGNGVTGKLLLNGVELDSQAIAANDTVGLVPPRSSVVNMMAGDIVDLALTPFGANLDGEDGCDGSANWLQVTVELPDTDGDGKFDHLDNCPTVANAGQEDGDSDGAGDVCDNCSSISNANQADRNNDGQGDVCDDQDGDTVVDASDNCPDASNAGQVNSDPDALGDACDNCPGADNADQADRDRDGVGDVCEPPALADSYDDWSVTGTQGEKGWDYGYYNLTLDPDTSYAADDFIPFFNDGTGVVSDTNQWGGDHWRLAPDAGLTLGPWTFIGRGDVHPNGTNSTPLEEHWSMLRWVSNHTGKVAITWHLREVNLGGTGVTGYLFLNGEQLDTALVPGGDAVGVKRTVVKDIAPGDEIDLACGPQGDAVCSDLTDPGDGADGSFFILRISTTIPPAPPAPPTVVASSEADWSLTGSQGENNWFYGYYDQRADAEAGDGVYGADDFIEFLNDGSGVVSTDPAFDAWKAWPNHWDGNHWDLLEQVPPATEHGPWTDLTCGGGHPAANAQGDLSVHWTLRRWVSEVTGDARISGYYQCPAPCGDGTVCRVLRNGTEVFSAVSRGAGINYSVDTPIASGDTIDFAIDSDGALVYDPANAAATIGLVQDGCDTTISIAKIALLTPPGTKFHRGDADVNGTLQLTDAVRILNSLFLGTGVLPCRDAADSDDNGALQLTDAVRILNVLFLGTGSIPAPGPGLTGEPCGLDPTDDDLDCASYPADKCP